uniref:Myotubularin phosphatase domain-containing protein n=1 Tax=Parascaris equorum TaxID=6256 RepID=A0A914RG95_PAREQ
MVDLVSDAELDVPCLNSVGDQLCETYPQKVIVPKSLTDEELRAASEGRFLNRFPAVVWRCKEKGTVLLRSSQPRVGLFSYRYPQDERILECVRNALPE